MLGNTNVNIRVSGGTITIPTTGGPYVGKHIEINTTKGVAIDGVHFAGVQLNWNVAIVSCEDVEVHGVVIDSGNVNFEDGLHFISCQRVEVSDCDIRCGDDALAFTQESPLTTANMQDVVVTNCNLWSRSTNALKFLIGSGITQTISRVRVSNVVARCGVGAGTGLAGNGIILRDHNGQFRIFDIEIDGFLLDAAFSEKEPIYIRGVRDVRLQKVVCTTPDGAAKIDNCQDIELRDCILDSPRAAGAACLEVAGASDDGAGNCTNVRILGGRYLNAKGRGVVIGSISGAFSVNPFEISHAQITGAAMAGLYIPRGLNGLVCNNTITGNAGLDINEEAASSNNLIIANRVQGNVPGAISSLGANTQVVRNVTTPGQRINDSGGFRQTIDGWAITINATTQSSPIPMPRNFGGLGRFRAVRSGSVTGIVLTTSVGWAAGFGSLTVTPYKNNTGLADANGAALPTLTAIINSTTNPSRVAVTVPVDLNTDNRFEAGDELYIQVSWTNWNTTPTNVYCALEIED